MTELSHYGVPGMKWGVRRSQAQLDRKAGRAEKKAVRKASDAKLNKADVAEFGKGGARRIEKRVAKGKTHTQAQRAEIGRRIAVGVLATAAASAIKASPGLIVSGLEAQDNRKFNKQQAEVKERREAGAREAAAIFSDLRGLTDLNTISLSPSDYTSTTATQAKAQAAEAAKAARDKIINDAVNADVNEQMKGWAEDIYKDKNKKRR